MHYEATVPTWSDKLLQEVLRSILDAYYEPQFDSHSHGFRPRLGCHTALGDIAQRWRGVKWFIEGDIAQCFDRLDHSVMLSILSEKLHDNRLLRLISNLLKAGYLEDWKYHATLSGSPQGGVISPILSNIYLDKLDRYVATVLVPKHHRGERRKRYPPYMALLREAAKQRKSGRYDEAKRLRQQTQRMPSRDPNDPDFRRLRYVRYADDFLLGFSGPKQEAEEIKLQLKKFLESELKLELSHEKTLITNARTEAAKFLGYEVVTLDADDKHDRHGHRCINGAPGLKVPAAVIRKQCARYLRRGQPIHLPERLNDTDFSIVSQYQAEYRGVVNYYLMAFNVHRLCRFHWIAQTSLLKTLANK